MSTVTRSEYLQDRTAGERWDEVEAFAFSPEFERFCVIQTAWVTEGRDEALTQHMARHVGIDAHRRRLEAADILLAKSIIGCKRSPSLDEHEHWSRYHRCLRWLLVAYHQEPTT